MVTILCSDLPWGRRRSLPSLLHLDYLKVSDQTKEECRVGILRVGGKEGEGGRAATVSSTLE